MRIDRAVYTPEMVELFFKRLAQLGQVNIVCERLGINKNTPTYWRKRHPEFAKRWEEFKKA